MERDFQVGDVVGPYRIDALIGQGGMATVYRVWNGSLARSEAMKVLRSELTHDDNVVKRFLREAQMSARLRHPNIGAVYAVSGADSNPPFFCLELIEGGDLADLIARRGRMTVEETALVLRQVADALDYAHAQDIIHRDVKPANILLTNRGNLQVSLVDFGIARAQESKGTRFTQNGMIVGTPEYMSPEQAGSGRAVDFRTDIYALGIVAYEMLSGHPPFGQGEGRSTMSVLMDQVKSVPKSLVGLIPGVSASVNRAVMRALAKNPAERFGSCAEFVRALGGEAGVGAAPRNLNKSQARGSGATRNATTPLMVGVVALAAIGGGFLFLGAQKPASNETVAQGQAPMKIEPSTANSHSTNPSASPESAPQSVPADSPSTPPKAEPAHEEPPKVITKVVYVERPAAPAPAPATAASGTFRYPEMSSQLLDRGWVLAHWNTVQRGEAVNELSARYGHEFTKASLRSYFNSMPWYHGVSGRKDEDRFFTRVEKANWDLVASMR